jgi:hypothetical protein
MSDDQDRLVSAVLDQTNRLEEKLNQVALAIRSLDETLATLTRTLDYSSLLIEKKLAALKSP